MFGRDAAHVDSSVNADGSGTARGTDPNAGRDGIAATATAAPDALRKVLRSMGLLSDHETRFRPPDPKPLLGHGAHEFLPGAFVVEHVGSGDGGIVGAGRGQVVGVHVEVSDADAVAICDAAGLYRRVEREDKETGEKNKRKAK